MVAVVAIKGPTGIAVSAGDGQPVRVMALIGSTSKTDERAEALKVDKLAQVDGAPDIIADLSTRISSYPLWRRILEAGKPAATLPIYTTPRSNNRLDRSALLDRVCEHIDGGVAMITIHPTARRDIIDLAGRRAVPCTSRGGGLVIKDLIAHAGAENAYLAILPEVAAAASKHDVVISLGATFRSATIQDAGDEAQCAEMAFQTQLATELRDAGCSVIVEGPGHAPPATIAALAKRLRQSGCPVMPLGPIPTDAAIGQDHISAAIGATLLGLEGAAHLLAAVTREEHTGDVPKIESTLEAIAAARVAARVIDLHRLGLSAEEQAVAAHRAMHRTCVVGRERAGCSRCAGACPL